MTMQCAINMTFQFFFHLMIWISVAIDEINGVTWQLYTMENMNCRISLMTIVLALACARCSS